MASKKNGSTSSDPPPSYPASAHTAPPGPLTPYQPPQQGPPQVAQPKYGEHNHQQWTAPGPHPYPPQGFPSNQGWGPPPSGYYGPYAQQPMGGYQQPYGYPPGGYYARGPMYYQQPQGYYERRGGGATEGILAGLLGALACCCCLDFMF